MYIRRFHNVPACDMDGVQTERAGFNVANVLAKFKPIEYQATVTSVFPQGSQVTGHAEATRRGGQKRDHFRALQPYTVHIHPQALRALQEKGAVEDWLSYSTPLVSEPS